MIDEAIWQTRIDEYLEFATSVDHSSNPSGINAYLGRARRDPDFVWPIETITVESLGAVFAQIDNWEDTRDFRFMDLHWMLALGQGDTPMTQLSPEVIASLAPKSVTAPVAMGIAEQLGGIPALAAVFAVLTGLVGAITAKLLLDAARIRPPAVRGFALGTASHGVGAARALQVHPDAGAYAALALGLQVLLAALLMPFIARLF